MDRFKGKRPLKLYDVYKGNKHIMTGNVLEIANKLNLTIKGVENYINSDTRKHQHLKYLILPIEGTGKVIYAMYDQDELIGVGTANELAKQLSIQPDTIISYAAPSRRKLAKNKNRRYAIRLDTQEIEEIHRYHWMEE